MSPTLSPCNAEDPRAVWQLDPAGNWSPVVAPWGEGNPVEWVAENTDKASLRALSGGIANNFRRVSIYHLAGRPTWQADAEFVAVLAAERGTVVGIVFGRGLPSVAGLAEWGKAMVGERVVVES